MGRKGDKKEMKEGRFSDQLIVFLDKAQVLVLVWSLWGLENLLMLEDWGWVDF